MTNPVWECEEMEQRPNPDAILKQIEEEKVIQEKGKLKIFFGYAAGVGKTYAMLEAAHAAQKAGMDVVVGYIEPHTRPDTLALLEGLCQLPPLEIPYKGITLREFDLDSAIKRKPRLILVDELAHTNAENCRHRKRYQDIQELLRAGIDVYTTVNVQHLESLNDIVASITGVVVRERIPDDVFDDADQVELVDVEPEDLIKRLNEGKIYKYKQAKKALGNFFQQDNLVALREIALRRTADRVNKISEKNKPWMKNSNYYTDEHILICLSSSPSNAKVIRTAARMASAFHGMFTAVYVETSQTKTLSKFDQQRLADNLRLAEQMGAKIVNVFGDDIAQQIAGYAKLAGVSKIVLGRSQQRRHLLFSSQSFADKLTQLAPNLDIYIIPEAAEEKRNSFQKIKGGLPVRGFSLLDSLKALGILVACTALGLWLRSLGFTESNIIMVYILGVLVTALCTKSKSYSLISSIISVLAFNFFFTVPRLSFNAYEAGYPVTFVIMFLVAFITSTLTMKVKQQAFLSAAKAYRTEILLETSQKLQKERTIDGIIKEAAGQMTKLLDRPVVFYTPDKKNKLIPRIFGTQEGEDTSVYINEEEQAVAEWVYKNNKHAGATTSTLPGAKCLYLAVRNKEQALAVAGVVLNSDMLESFEKSLLIAMLSECALALEKQVLNEKKNEIALKAQQEQLRANLLRAISHDLRTPLTSISGNASVLMQNGAYMEESQKNKIYTDIFDDSMWLINLVENLLSVTRIDNGTMNIQMQAELLEEVITEALHHINRKSTDHKIQVELEDEFLMGKMDSRLIVQVFINIIDNAIKYTQKGSCIRIIGRKKGNYLYIEIEDDGPGIGREEQEKLFDMFYTANNERGDSRRGLGLGLALCKSIITAHGGNIGVKENIPHGTIFYFTLPAEEVIIHE